jgi:CheY-like chemotaxis protein
VAPRPGSLADRLATAQSVLVVEDEPDIANFLAAFFRASGMGMAHVNPSRVHDVIEAALDHQVACVLLDINLAGLSGLDVLAELRVHPRLGTLPVVVVSALVDADTMNRARQLGVTAYVPKPFAVADLFDQVVRLLEGDGAVPAAGVLGRADLEAEIDVALAVAAHDPTMPVGFALVRVRGPIEPVAEALHAALPLDAVLGRSEADELAVLLPGADATSVVAVLGRALQGCRTRVGVAVAPDHATTSDELYMAADAALAEAAERGEPVAVAR